MSSGELSATVHTPDHLYTWFDVEQHFTTLAERGEWPSWLREVDAYWDSVRLVVDDHATDGEVWAWLKQVLGLLTADPEAQEIRLDDVGEARPLPVEIDRSTDAVPFERQPRWVDRRVRAELSQPLPHPAAELPPDVVIAAFHSFKGGVGRTLHCVTVARELARAGKRVLLVDGDLEAPGITWMVADSLRLDFSFEDFLALVHGSADGRYRDAVRLGRKHLVNQEIDGVVVMPARRDYERVAPPRIRPDDLLTPDRDPYLLTQALAELAKEVGAGIVLVDLRAGASELSAPLLLDPRVHRVVVATISDQSVRGARQLLRQLALRAPATGEADPACTVLLTQYLPQDHQTARDEAAADLQAAALMVSHPPAGPEIARTDTDRDVEVLLLDSHFNSYLLSLPSSWHDVLARCDRAGLREAVQPFVDNLLVEVGAATSSSDPASQPPHDDLLRRRRQLSELASEFIYAETTSPGDLLVTDPVRALVEAHRSELPIEVIIGSKGSGKTFTYLQLCQAGSWQAFARTVKIDRVSLPVQTVPVLSSASLSKPQDLEGWRRRAAQSLTGQTPVGSPHELLLDKLGSDLSQLEWRRVWLTCLARSVGLAAEPGNVEERLAEFARRHRALFAIDGLEDRFQEFHSCENQQRALRALLVDCPEWLRALHGRPLGLVVFARRDLVQAALPSNFGQFEKRHEKYALRWSREEALRLTAWICQRAEALPVNLDQRKGNAELSRLMVPLWGQKMGSPKSREARSERWFFAALSDFHQQVQPRDIVLFLHEAAKASVADQHYTDRILAPAAMRGALVTCSKQKIDAIEEENKPVGRLLEQLTQLGPERRRVPLPLSDLALSPEDAKLLVTNGILYLEGDQGWIPEIYRHGLGFKATGRPRVVGW